MSGKKKFKVPLPVAYSNEPVMTTAQLAEYYGCEPRQIKQNFNNNQERFEEGKHYFKLEDEALKTFKSLVENFDLPLSKFAPTLYLWTRRGAARHAKMLNTEKAWEVFEKLEEFYFDYEKFHWQQARLDSKISTRRMTDAIANFLIPLAVKQGIDAKKISHFYGNYNRLINKCAGIKSDSRDVLTEKQLYEVEKMSDIAGKLIEKYVSQETDHHEIYCNVKNYLWKYVEISML